MPLALRDSESTIGPRGNAGLKCAEYGHICPDRQGRFVLFFRYFFPTLGFGEDSERVSGWRACEVVGQGIFNEMDTVLDVELAVNCCQVVF